MIADLTGSLLYMKYYTTGSMDSTFDGVAYDIKHSGGANNYTVKLIITFVDGKKREATYNWTDSPTEQKIYNNQAFTSSYAIPYLENNFTAVLYMCATDDGGHHRHITQVLTANLDNDLTKALEVARKISPDLTELPFKNKHLF